MVCAFGCETVRPFHLSGNNPVMKTTDSKRDGCRVEDSVNFELQHGVSACVPADVYKLNE